jgi:hypothetical protein
MLTHDPPPRWSPQNRTVVITSKPASRAGLRTSLLYPSGAYCGKRRGGGAGSGQEGQVQTGVVHFQKAPHPSDPCRPPSAGPL